MLQPLQPKHQVREVVGAMGDVLNGAQAPFVAIDAVLKLIEQKHS
jgi:hypothetical protein